MEFIDPNYKTFNFVMGHEENNDQYHRFVFHVREVPKSCIKQNLAFIMFKVTKTRTERWLEKPVPYC